MERLYSTVQPMKMERDGTIVLHSTTDEDVAWWNGYIYSTVQMMKMGRDGMIIFHNHEVCNY